MQVSVFPCPHCGARLRLRDRSLAGRTIPCPDCRRPVAVTTAPDGRLVGVSATQAGSSSPQPLSQTSRNPSPAVEPPAAALLPATQRRPLLRRLTSPAGIGWGAALVAAAALCGFVFVETGESTTDDEHGPLDSNAATRPTDGLVAAADSGSAGEPEDPETRLLNLGEWITRHRTEHGRFPAALGHDSDLAFSDRLSWLAALAVAHGELNRVQPQADRAWHDPLNDRFVRQRVAEFQNPLVDEIVGIQGYPAAHFAGVAGVGGDAPSLAKEHPRAGIFGEDRLSTSEDVLDGLSSTLMVVGVQSNLTSWAANGSGTLRALTAEPYLHGPDGLGTGQPDGMFVLMADGSVRFLADQTDPRLLRRMAAMHDGLPLDLSVPGEPGEAGSAVPEPVVVIPVESPPAAVAVDPVDEEPIGVMLAPDEARFDVDGTLAMPVLRFTQHEPIPVRVLLRQLEELGGVPIDFSEVLASPAASRLDQSVSVDLSEITYGEILRAVLAEVEMSFTAGPQGITLHAAGESP